MRKIIATTLLLFSAPAMAGTYVAPVVRVAPAPVVRVAPVHVAPVVRVNPVVRVSPVVRAHPVVRTHTVVKPVTTIGRPVVHRHHHHPRTQPVIVYTAAQKPKCAQAKPGSKECAKK
jgi:hypothetical protein